MNAKAESFKKFLDEKKINAFTSEELQDNQFHSVVFRSKIDIHGNQLPTIVVLDDTPYCMIRVAVAPQAQTADSTDKEKAALAELINGYNRKYKPLKFYLDQQGNLVLDVCLFFKDETEVDGDLIYSMYDLIIRQLTDEYKNIMKAIWG
ncbi:MAG: hypothetical protein LKE33_00580 [Acidaminococcus sp.]|jgi:hypothetical protein|nr:hypothetical protein [Acidaminococcus sp.]MCI2100406.1 hypothetical protein [Acidaminococcus sp.]MCI2114727.1 hypothetical protein [Acidaminococcus sp.]MCI2116795.1 hypothetical protein [Acidaminococcus sp.]